MSGVTQYRAVLHNCEIFLVYNLFTSGNGYEEISDLSRFIHGHYIESVHNSLDSLDGIYLRHDNSCAEALGSHGGTLSAPSVACNNYYLACNDQIGRTVYAIPYRLSGAVSVIEEMLAVSVVNPYHGELEGPCLIHGFKPYDTCCCLLTSANDIRDQVSHFRMNHIYQITAVIDYDVRTVFQGVPDMHLIFFIGCSIPCMNL